METYTIYASQTEDVKKRLEKLAKKQIFDTCRARS